MKEQINRSPFKNRIAELTIGYVTVNIIGYFFDYIIYPIAIYELGILKGGLLMMGCSFAVCMAGIKFYDWTKRDWLGIETIKGWKDYSGKRAIGRCIAWILRKSDLTVFLFLSVKFDPFVTTAYLRHGKFNGMSRRDWIIFMGSLFIANIYWTLASYLGISAVEWVWKAVAG